MTLNVDTSRALRTHRQLAELVDAILTAPTTEPETHAVEWKSTLDLASGAAHRFALSKQILAFANRSPDDAAREFEGCAYIVIGAEPQLASPGACRHDPATLDDWIEPFVASDGPRWKADYVTVSDCDILVIAVEAPRWGDPIYVVQRTFDRFKAGRAFIRRQGKSVEPDPNEMRMLEDRLKRSATRIRVGVDFGGDRPVFCTYATLDREWTEWLTAERRRLLGPFQAQMGEVRVHDPAARRSLGARALAAITAEDRSARHYQEVVDEYLARAKDRWQAVIWDTVIEQGLADLDLRLTNPTEENYSGVQVVLTLPPAAYVFTNREHPHKILDAPNPPAPWGQPRQLWDPVPTVPASFAFAERTTITVGDSWVVTFPAVDLRPHQPVPLAKVHLAIPDAFHNGEIEMRWAATSTSAAGRAEGTVTVGLASTGVQISALPPG
jgi:hypothetical protein